MAREPIIPANKDNPANQTRRIRGAMSGVNKIIDATQEWLLLQIDQMPKRVVNAALANARYEYLIDLSRLSDVVAQIVARMQMAEAPVTQAAAGAYAEGTGMAATNLSRLTDDYARTVTSVLASEPYIRRAALVQARVFEEMQGLAGDTGTDLARVLFDGIEQGLNPLEIARSVRERFDVSRSRAERIARTEVIGALRRGRLDEAKDAQDRLGIKTGMLWLSALSPTTRASHARRHGRVYTVDEVREFYSKDGNGVNCKCAQTEILLNDDGTPLSQGVIKRMTARRQAYEAAQDSGA